MHRLCPLLLLVALTAPACSLRDPPPSNVRPPKPGVPAEISDVTGIYRSIHQGLLQLRRNGQYTLIVSAGPGATAGSFTLRDGRMSVVSSECGATTGEYDVVVSGEQKPGKAVLNLAAVDDQCSDRQHFLTVDPWIYAES